MSKTVTSVVCRGHFRWSVKGRSLERLAKADLTMATKIFLMHRFLERDCFMTVFYDRWPPQNSFQFDFSTSSNKKKQEIHSNKYEFIISLTITRESDFFANVGDAE